MNSNGTPLRVALYGRVSTPDQHIETQMGVLRDYAVRMDYEAVGEYADVGYSGKDERRPQFERLLADMRRGAFQGIVCYKLDRIGRSTLHLANLVEEFRKRRIEFISVTQAACNTTTPEGKFFFDILAAVAELERAMIIARTRDGLARARRQGKRLGRPPGSGDKRPRRKSGYYLRWATGHRSKQSDGAILTAV